MRCLFEISIMLASDPLFKITFMKDWYNPVKLLSYNFLKKKRKKRVERLLLLEHASRTVHDRPYVGTALSSSFRKI
jgi:hypothetical protein